MRTFLSFIFIFISCGAYSQNQYEFEPSEQFPYGKINPNAPEQLADFAPLIGNCECTSESRNPDQTWAKPIKMTWKFKYIMNGMAIQDETLKEDGRHSGSIRQFNKDSLKWYVHYYSSGSPVSALPAWEGTKKEDDNIVLYRKQKAPNGMDGFYRLTFYAIDDKGYKWIGEWVNEDETIAFPTWKISCVKK